MIALLLASMIAAHSPGTSSALRICKPAIARKAEGEIADISVNRSTLNRRTRTLRGNVTVFVGMGTPPPGSASAHHLIRAQYAFSCSTRAGRVRKVTLSQ
jgi:hypothetical protein